MYIKYFGVKYPCTICVYKATLQGDLTKHIQSQHKGKILKCNSCDKEYKHASGLNTHTKSAHEGVKYDCNICQSSFTLKCNLRIHIKSIHFKEKYSCKICDYQATRKGTLSIHIKNVHHKLGKVICTECNKTIQKETLTQHKRVFHSGEKTIYNCKICTFQTIHQSSLNQHVKNVHHSRNYQS